MRRLVNLAIATTLLIAGLAAAGWLLLGGEEIRWWMIFGTGFVALAGFLWLYEDYWPSARD